MHVFADLSPYICTFANCSMELAQFPTRAAWADHEFSEHRVIRWWDCFECTKRCYSETEWKEHTEYGHQRIFIGAKYHVAEKMALKTRVKAAETEKCPLCQVTLGKSRREFVKHVGRHMEEIALVALPREIDEESDANSRSIAAELSSISSLMSRDNDEEAKSNKSFIHYFGFSPQTQNILKEDLLPSCPDAIQGREASLVTRAF